MPRARSPDSIKAEEMYQSGMKMVDIASNLGVPAGTVRRWKSTQNWGGDSKKKQSERSETKIANVRKRGAPAKNKNAKGHGAPAYNQNATKHGAYSDVYWDFLKEGEEALLDSPDDEELLLMEQIRLFSIRERRIMKAINKYMDVSSGQYIYGALKIEDKRTFKNAAEKNLYEQIVSDKVKSGDRLPGERYNQQTTTQSTIDLVARLERELTSVQSKKTKAIGELAKLRLAKEALNQANSGKEAVDDWISAVIGEEDEGLEVLPDGE